MPNQKRNQVRVRVRRIHGHVHSIVTMLDEGRSYTEIVQQVIAVRAALNGVIGVIIDELVEDCIAKTGTKQPFEDSMTELQSVIARVKG